MAIRGRIQKPKIGRASSGVSPFNEWRGRLGLTQGAAAELLDVNPTSTQRWDAHPHLAPALLAPAMVHHETMRLEVKWLKAELLDEEDASQLRAGIRPTQAATAENLKYLSPAGKLALEYGLAHRLI